METRSFLTFADATIDVRATETDGEVVLEVEDNGQGIDPHYMIKYSTCTSVAMSVKGQWPWSLHCKKAVKKLDGRISLNSDKGKGSVFRVTFPANQTHSDGSE